MAAVTGGGKATILGPGGMQLPGNVSPSLGPGGPGIARFPGQSVLADKMTYPV